MRLHFRARQANVDRPAVLKVTRDPIPELAERTDFAFVADTCPAPSELQGYGAFIGVEESSPALMPDGPWLSGIGPLSYLANDDIVAIQPDGMVRVLYRRDSQHNFILATNMCNSFCLMCSQPPTQQNDLWRIEEHLRLVRLIPKDTRELGITGGEPTLLKGDFLRLVQECRDRLPETHLQVLTNGRLFYYRRFAQELAAIEHPGLLLGIPLYSDVDRDHDHIVQAKGAFKETVIGLHNLGEAGVPVEIRIVLHKLSIKRLERWAEFVTRNLPFAAHVALMGLEMTGFVHRNFEELWVDPGEYKRELDSAISVLRSVGLNVSIYNQPLCLLPDRLWPFARKSISDWKNLYLDECEGCTERVNCCGFFHSAAKKHSSQIRVIR